ncbi:MAG TPA: S9 family peptidase [Actinomycetota bacterium]|nr:S9 family peptidase [Actinomycetota bacterium]
MQTTTKLIPREILFGNPEKVSPTISPDGTKLAYLAPKDGVLNVWVKTIGSDDDKVVTDDRDRGIRGYFWAKDNRHVMYVQDVGGDENFRLYWVDLQTGDTRDLTPFEKVQVQVVKQSKHHPNHILLGINKDNPQLHDVYRLDLTTGDLEKVAENPGFIGWVVDFDMKVRGAMAPQPDGGFVLVHRETEQDEWKPIVQWGPQDALSSGPAGFTRDGQHMYLIDPRNANAGKLVKLNVGTGDIEVIAEDPKYDVAGAVIHPDTTEVQMIAFLRSRLEWQVLDESIRADIDVISGLEPGDYGISSRDDEDRTWLVSFDRDNGPVSYYAYDRASKQATFLFHHRPELNDYPLAEMDPISFKSRDGLDIHGYITFPLGVERKNLPLVLDVHGGPWARDSWGFNPEAQWLANRGYACLQVNFRGSTGYGKDFVNAGDREWGGKMQDDLTDAVKWAIDQGFADPDRVCIYGGSYGGYAALAGATFTPDLYKCAVDLVGPSSLLTFINTIPPYWMPLVQLFHHRVGHPEQDAEFLKTRSPLFHVDRIKIPMLIAQGANDPRVNQAESEQIVEAMKKKGIDHEYMLFPDEGHGFAKPENRMKFYEAVERFLARHLGGRSEN